MNIDFIFDKEKFLGACQCGCSKGRQVILDKIEQAKDSEPELVKYLEWYRDDLWNKQMKDEAYRKLRYDIGDDQLNKNTIIALRAMADKLEEPGYHFMIHCELPKLPIFAAKIDEPDGYAANISVTLVRCPLGG